jgi:putative glutamine amidotransferase
MGKKPVILITTEQGYSIPEFRYSPLFSLEKRYGSFIAENGGLPLSPLETNAEELYAAAADGLLLSGGVNHIHPGRYATPFLETEGVGAKLNFFRDQLEFDLFHAFFEAGKPIFGIGRGNLLVNVALGGSLIQKLPAEEADETLPPRRLSPQGDSILTTLFGGDISVTNGAAQGIDRLGKDLRVTARTAGDIPAALEHLSKPVFSVQFHPERSAGPRALRAETDTSALFAYFIELCAGRERYPAPKASLPATGGK